MLFSLDTSAFYYLASLVFINAEQHVLLWCCFRTYVKHHASTHRRSKLLISYWFPFTLLLKWEPKLCSPLLCSFVRFVWFVCSSSVHLVFHCEIIRFVLPANCNDFFAYCSHNQLNHLYHHPGFISLSQSQSINISHTIELASWMVYHEAWIWHRQPNENWNVTASSSRSSFSNSINRRYPPSIHCFDRKKNSRMFNNQFSRTKSTSLNHVVTRPCVKEPFYHLIILTKSIRFPIGRCVWWFWIFIQLSLLMKFTIVCYRLKCLRLHDSCVDGSK